MSQGLMDRRAFIATVGGSLLAAALSAGALQAEQVPRRNIALEPRWAKGEHDRYPAL